MVGVAQLVRAPLCGSGGRGFKSRHSPQITSCGKISKISLKESIMSKFTQFCYFVCTLVFIFSGLTNLDTYMQEKKTSIAWLGIGNSAMAQAQANQAQLHLYLAIGMILLAFAFFVVLAISLTPAPAED